MIAAGRQRVSVRNGQTRVYWDNPGRNRRHDGPQRRPPPRPRRIATTYRVSGGILISAQLVRPVKTQS